jgi:hypothetical protein
VDPNQSLWFAAPGSSLSNNEKIASTPDAKKLLEKIESITYSVYVGQDLKMALSILAKSPEEASEIDQAVKQYLAGNQKELAAAKGFLEAINIETTGRMVSMKAHYSEEDIEKALKGN